MIRFGPGYQYICYPGLVFYKKEIFFLASPKV